jgi:TPR repeat protein
MYQNEMGLEKDLAKAVELYTKSAEQGFAQAQYILGALFHNGEGVPRDPVTSYAWTIISADNGDEQAKRFKPNNAKRMTTEQIAEAEALAKEMIKKNPKLIKKKA